ncbi:hypothetical protein, partial [Acetobacter cerevisiae]|uniref:hypothetical protein n=1 Tax=Acetobacter cerevisiae TaxID=178900 RepID=UPI001ADECC95
PAQNRYKSIFLKSKKGSQALFPFWQPWMSSGAPIIFPLIMLRSGIGPALTISGHCAPGAVSWTMIVTGN